MTSPRHGETYIDSLAEAVRQLECPQHRENPSHGSICNVVECKCYSEGEDECSHIKERDVEKSRELVRNIDIDEAKKLLDI